MLRFSISYFIWMGLLFFLFFFSGISPFFIINELQTQLTILITQNWVTLFDLPVLIQADTLILKNGLHLQILHECNGLTPFLLYAAAILAYPAYSRAKAVWLFFGYILLVAINTLRMLFITLVVTDYPDQFHLVHDWIGRYTVAILTIALFFWFTERVQVKTGNKKYEISN